MRVIQKLAAGFFVTTFSLFASPLLGFEGSTSAGASGAADPLYVVMPPKDFADVKLATTGRVGGQSSVAVNPKNANDFVTAYAAGGSCWVRTSTNAGQTWAAAKKLPMLAGKPNCDNPVVTWAPDGSRVYAAYSYRSTFTDKWGDVYTKEAGVVATSSLNKGLSWSSPSVAATYSGEYDQIVSLRIAAPVNGSDTRSLYVLITWLPFDDDVIDLVRSGDQGKTWFKRHYLVGGDDIFGAFGASVAAGPEGEVLVAWTFFDCQDFPCAYEIQVNRSKDYGATFQNQSIVPNTSGETAVAFGGAGVAHLVYSAYEPASPGTYYVYSTKPPYTSWSSPVVLSDNLSANHHYSPAITASACGSGTSVLHAVWLDDRAGSGKYNVYYTRKVAKTGEAWSPNLRVSGTSPLSNDYPLFTPSIAAGAGNAVGVWGQAWNAGSHPVWASRIGTGVNCP